VGVSKESGLRSELSLLQTQAQPLPHTSSSTVPDQSYREMKVND